MPRRRRRRRRRGGSAPASQPASPELAVELTPRRRWRPPAAVVLALCLGIWIGLAVGGGTTAGDGALAAQIALWISVIGAGLAGGRILRRWMQGRRNR